MPELDRRFVKPAHPKASIPDPSHRCDLPAEGCEVIWDHYWADHLAKGNVVVVPAEDWAVGWAAQLAETASPPAPDAPVADPAA